MSVRKVLDVGQCGYDHGNISGMLAQQFGVHSVAAHSPGEALELLGQESFDLVLVNRLFDANGAPGLELIKKIKEDPKLKGTPVMLVSNLQDAQDEAIAAGALPGFGKSSLHAPITKDRLKTVLAPVTGPTDPGNR